MCGRFLIEGDMDDLYRKVILHEAEAVERIRGEIRPTDLAPVMVLENGEKQIKLMKWGLKGYPKGQPIINARSETLLIKPRFSRLAETNRCIVPASGFFEWKKVNGQKIKCLVKAKEPLFFAGLYEPGRDGDCFTIITMESEGEMLQIHNRMPISLSKVEPWLSPKKQVSEVYEALLKEHPVYMPDPEKIILDQLSFF